MTFLVERLAQLRRHLDHLHELRRNVLVHGYVALDTPAWPEPLTSGNAIDVLERETFLLPQPDPDRVQEAIAASVVTALLSKPLDAEGLAAALADAAAARHLQLYLARGEEQRLVERMGAAGDPQVPPNPLMVSWQGASASRAGYFAEPSLVYRADLGPDGSAEVTLEVALRNGAPDGPPSCSRSATSCRRVPSRRGGSSWGSCAGAPAHAGPGRDPPPAGSRAGGRPRRATEAGGGVSWTGSPEEPVELALRYTA